MGAGQTDRPLRLRCAIVTADWSWLPLAAVLGLTLVVRTNSIGPVLQALVVATLLQVLVKRLAKRLSSRRPFAIGLCANHLQHSDRGGMPSTHAAVMACLAGSLSPWMVAWPEIALVPIIAVITAWARVHAGAHFPSDVLAGLMLGESCGYAASQVSFWA
ncbi:phosphatase PAP2 family protein [Hydrogenophaga sp.]|uniref:phosphatase PAP2 family protein n=1 Tax=Hydrogenophaga sp. TaxID=1904254 RepID=UPI00261F07C4|nr:phosphatase PAP2 family protein [Hydrogenophaga sp.]MDM7950851.1 phosphatase PAP2 family protein [Hydrogenophaga sp.]